MNKDHGRIEVRHHVLGAKIARLAQKPEGTGLQAVGRLESLFTRDDQTTTEYRYYLCSFADLARFAETMRSHWGIENNQQRVPGIQFGEDANRARTGSAAEKTRFGGWQ
jgi:predicted transposase YbfD/YdcC